MAGAPAVRLQLHDAHDPAPKIRDDAKLLKLMLENSASKVRAIDGSRATRELGVPANLNGQDWLWQQLNHQRCITIYFEGELTVTFEAVSGSDDLLASMILWEAAILEAVKEEEGGVTLQALVRASPAVCSG